jgi:hypothetical protein
MYLVGWLGSMTRRFLVEVVAPAWLGVGLRRIRRFAGVVGFDVFGVILSVDVDLVLLVIYSRLWYVWTYFGKKFENLYGGVHSALRL